MVPLQLSWALGGCINIAFSRPKWRFASNGTPTRRRNLRKHRLSFEEAATAFEDERSLTLPDLTHSVGEERLLLLGRTSRGRVVVAVAFTERGEDIDTIRII